MSDDRRAVEALGVRRHLRRQILRRFLGQNICIRSESWGWGAPSVLSLTILSRVGTPTGTHDLKHKVSFEDEAMRLARQHLSRWLFPA